MEKQSFEEAMKRLEEIVQELEKGELPLEDSIKRFEEGMNLIRFCSKKLDEAEQKVTMLIREGDDQYREVPFFEDKSGDG